MHTLLLTAAAATALLPLPAQAMAAQPAPPPPAAGAPLTAPAPVTVVSAAEFEAIAAQARAIAAGAGGCEGFHCPEVDCDRMRRQMQQLINLETYLDEHLRALNAASADHGAHHASLTGQSGVTQANMLNAQGAIILHEMLHNIGSALLDLAALNSFLNGWSQGDELTRVARIDQIYEASKDAESLLNTLRAELTGMESNIASSGAIAPGVVDTLVAYGFVEPGATTAQVREGLNTAISQVTDAINASRELVRAFEAAREAGQGAREMARTFRANGGVNIVGQMIGRVAKGVSTRVLEERQANARHQIESLAAESGVQVEFYRQWMAIERARLANADALDAVREAKAAVGACLARWCGAGSFTRPVIPAFEVTGGGRTRYEWLRALEQMGDAVRDAAAALDPATAIENRPCPPDGQPVSQPAALVPSPDALPPELRVTTDCPACQDIADDINRMRARKHFLAGESTQIVNDLSRAAELRGERRRLIEQATHLNDELVAGRIPGSGGERRVNAAAMRAEIDALMARAVALRVEAERLEARRDELGAIMDEILELNGRLDRRGGELAICEARQCPAARLDPPRPRTLVGAAYRIDDIRLPSRSFLGSEFAMTPVLGLVAPQLDDTGYERIGWIEFGLDGAGWGWGSDRSRLRLQVDSQYYGLDEDFDEIDPGSGRRLLLPGPLGGPSGFSLGGHPANLIQDGFYRLDHEQHGVGAELRLGLSQFLGGEAVGVGGLHYRWGQSHERFGGHIPGFARDFAYESPVDLSQFGLRFGAAVEWAGPLGPAGRWRAQAEATAGPDFNEGDGSDTLSFTAFADSVAEVEASRTDWGGKVGVGLSWEFDRLSLGADLRYERRTGFPVIERDGDGPSRLRLEDADSVVGGVTATLRF